MIAGMHTIRHFLEERRYSQERIERALALEPASKWAAVRAIYRPPLFGTFSDAGRTIVWLFVLQPSPCTWPERARHPGDRFGSHGSINRLMDHDFVDGVCIWCSRLRVLQDP